jgi:hypothetical protein
VKYRTFKLIVANLPALLILVVLLSGYPLHMKKPLLATAQGRVDRHNRQNQPDIRILTGWVEIPDGGASDAFAAAV